MSNYGDQTHCENLECACWSEKRFGLLLIESSSYINYVNTYSELSMTSLAIAQPSTNGNGTAKK